MLAVRAVSDYEAHTEDQISVKEGQLFYVLSVTADGRKYYLSTSSRVPFSRSASAGFAPMPLFVVVGDTLPAELRPKTKMVSVSQQKQQQQQQQQPQKKAPAPAQRGTAEKRPGNADSNNDGGSPVGGLTKRGSIKRLAVAAARSLLDGITGRGSSSAVVAAAAPSAAAAAAPPAQVEKMAPAVPTKDVSYPQEVIPAAPPSTPEWVPVNSEELSPSSNTVFAGAEQYFGSAEQSLQQQQQQQQQRRTSSDSGFSSMPATRKNSLGRPDQVDSETKNGLHFANELVSRLEGLVPTRS